MRSWTFQDNKSTSPVSPENFAPIVLRNYENFKNSCKIMFFRQFFKIISYVFILIVIESFTLNWPIANAQPNRLSTFPDII